MKTFVVFFFILISLSINAQREADNWCLGNKAVINFDDGKLIKFIIR